MRPWTPTARISIGALLLTATACAAACGAALPPLDRSEEARVQHGVKPGVFLLSDDVFADLGEDLLGAEVRPLESGAVAIIVSDTPRQNHASTLEADAFGSLSGFINVNHQVAYLATQRKPAGRFVFRQDSSYSDSLGGFQVQVGEPLKAVGIETPPDLPVGRAFVRAVAAAPRDRCEPNRSCEDFHDAYPVAVLVDGVGGPPGELKLELTPDSIAKLELETTLWTRVVVHLFTEATAEGHLLWVSRRHDLLRAARLYQSLEHEHDRDEYPYLRMTRAQLPNGLHQHEVVSAQVTYIDWTAPDLREAVLSDWDSWNLFVDELPGGVARRVDIRLDQPAP